jgi:hypothetical protein
MMTAPCSTSLPDRNRRQRQRQRQRQRRRHQRNLARTEVDLDTPEPDAMGGVGSGINALEHPPPSALPFQHHGLALATELHQMEVVFLIAFRVERGVKGLRGGPERAAGPALDALGTTQAYRQTGGRSRRRTSSRLAPTGNAVLPFPAGRGGGDGRVSASLGACSECWPLACLSEKPLLRPLSANCCLSRLRRWGCVRGLSALGERLAACGHIFSRRGSRPKGGGTPQGCPGL